MPRNLSYFLIFSLVVLSVGCWREKLIKQRLERKVDEVKLTFYYNCKNEPRICSSEKIINDSDEIKKNCAIISNKKSRGKPTIYQNRIDYIAKGDIIFTVIFNIHDREVVFKRGFRRYFRYLTEDGYKLLKSYYWEFYKNELGLEPELYK